MRREYRYRFNVLWAFLAIGLFGAAAVFFAQRALTNDRGLILNRVIELGEAGASGFYALLAVLSGVFVLMGLMGLVMPARTLVLSESAVEIPSGFLRRKTRRVKFSDVKSLEELDVSGTRLLTLVLVDGKASINNRMLRDAATYDEVCSFVRERVTLASVSAPPHG